MGNDDDELDDDSFIEEILNKYKISSTEQEKAKEQALKDIEDEFRESGEPDTKKSSS